MHKKIKSEVAKRSRIKFELAHPEYILWNAARQRSKRESLEFSINRSDIIIPERCPLLDIKLEPKRGQGRGGFWNSSPSLDRINNKLGYTPENIWVISWLANKMKSSATEQELIVFCINTLKYFSNETETTQKLIKKWGK